MIWSRICDGVGLSKAGSNVTAAIDKGIELVLSQGKIRAVDEIREDEEGNKRYYWFYYRTDTNLIPARNWEEAPDRNLLLISDEEIESMAHVLFGGNVQIGEIEQATKQIWSSFGFGRVTEKMVAQTEPILNRIASKIVVEPVDSLTDIDAAVNQIVDPTSSDAPVGKDFEAPVVNTTISEDGGLT